MKALVKDLEQEVWMVQGTEEYPVKTRYVIKYFAHVVIKRDDEFYEVPVRMTEEVDIGDLLEGINRAYKHFEKHCDDVYSKWIVQEESEFEGVNGKVITQRKIEL